MTPVDPLAFARIGLSVLAKLPARDAGHVILVTSAERREGKTFVAGLLSSQFASQIEGPTALVDASFSSGRLLNAAAVTAPEGFADLVEYGALPGRALQSTQSPRLTRITSGLVLKPDLMFTPFAVNRALDLLRGRFGLTVIDAPVLGQCGALAHAADAIVVVINSSRTKTHAVRRAVANAGVEASRIAGVVLNRHVPHLPAWAAEA